MSREAWSALLLSRREVARVEGLPLMRVLIYTFGTQGDILPYVALARGLVRAGHEAVVCTAEGFRGLVEARGVAFVHMGDEMLELVQGAMPVMRGPRDVGPLIRRMTAAMRLSLEDQWAACAAGGADGDRLPPEGSRRLPHRRTARRGRCGVPAPALLHPDPGVPHPAHRPLAAQRPRRRPQLSVQPVHRRGVRGHDQHLPPTHTRAGAVAPVGRLPPALRRLTGADLVLLQPARPASSG